MRIGATRQEGETWRQCVERYAQPYGLQRECLEIFDAAVKADEKERDAACGALAAYDLLEIVTGPLSPEKKANAFLPLHEPTPTGLKHLGKWVKVPPQTVDELQAFNEDERRRRKFDVVVPQYEMGPGNMMTHTGWAKSTDEALDGDLESSESQSAN